LEHDLSFQCVRCGERHELPFAYGDEAPFYWYGIPEDERSRRGVLGEEQCVLDEEYFFVRARILVPVHDVSTDLEWGVWVSLSEENFKRMSELWETQGRETEPPYFGWISTELPGYPSTINLKSRVHTRPVGVRPIVKLEPTDHPLSVEQRTGITLDRVKEIAATVLHGG
jgi:hypothetical protein